MSVSLEQYIMFAVCATRSEMKKLGFDDDFWEEYCDKNGYHGGPKVLDDGTQVVMHIEAGKYYCGKVLKVGNCEGALCGAFVFEDLKLGPSEEMKVFNQLSSLGFKQAPRYMMVSSYE